MSDWKNGKLKIFLYFIYRNRVCFLSMWNFRKKVKKGFTLLQSGLTVFQLV